MPQAHHDRDDALVHFHNSSMRVSHTMRHITHARSDHLFVCRQTSGSIFLEQDTREIVLEAGDVTLLDPLRSYDGRFSECSATLVLKVPRRELELRIGKIRNMTTRLIKPIRVEDDLTLSRSWPSCLRLRGRNVPDSYRTGL
jgi:AraC family transcriptional regulator, positive regulator of tynA and feaB